MLLLLPTLTMEEPGEEGYLLAMRLRGASVGPAYLARPTRSEEGRPSSPRRGGGGVPAGNKPAGRVRRPTRSKEGRPSPPRRGGGGLEVSLVYIKFP